MTGNRYGMSYLEPLDCTERGPRELLWTKCWRSIYAKAAEAFGYVCKWDGGTLAFFRDASVAECLHRPAGFVSSLAPSGRTFVMADLIKRAEDEWLKRNADKIRERAEQEEIKAELHSRMAAGEPSLLIEKFRCNPRHMLIGEGSKYPWGELQNWPFEAEETQEDTAYRTAFFEATSLC